MKSDYGILIDHLTWDPRCCVLRVTPGMGKKKPLSVTPVEVDRVAQVTGREDVQAAVRQALDQPGVTVTCETFRLVAEEAVTGRQMLSARRIFTLRRT